MLNLDMALFPRVISQLSDGRLIILDFFHDGRRSVFFLTGIDTYCGYGFVFPPCNASAKTAIHGLTECFIHHYSIPDSIGSDSGTHFTAKEVQQWAYDHGIHWSYHVPHHSEAGSLIECCNGLLKTQLYCQLVAIPCRVGTRFSRRLYMH